MNGSDAGDALIGVDWGTTHLRAYRIAPDGGIIDRRKSPLGVAAIRGNEFEAALEVVVGAWRSAADGVPPVLMCGMVGSRQGWREVPYLSCPARMEDVAAALQPLKTGQGPVHLVPGLEATDGRGRRDVMRGEETQILGAVPTTGQHLVVTPGTHSKWATVREGAIEGFRTYMTGEFYALLREHSVLGWSIGGNVDPTQDEAAFLEGVRDAAEDPDLLHSAFMVRTRGLFEKRPGSDLAAYLSGLLIGSEVSGAMRHHRLGPVTVIAAQPLARSYCAALTALGFADVQCVNASDAVTQGLWRLWALRRTLRP